MPERLLQLDDLRNLTSPEKIATLFGRLGYNAEAQPLDIEDLQLTSRSAEAVYDAYLIADQGDGGLQVLLFQLHPDEWSSASVASSRMKAIASQVGRRDTEFLLLATKDYNQLMLVNPRKSFDDKMNLRASIRKLLVDRTNPTAYDLDRLEAIAARGQSAQELYKAQCEAFDVEKLTKSFYKGYKQLFDKVQQAVKRHNDHPYFADPDRLHQFSQRLLGRLMFLYFLQKKEFLAGDRRFLTTQYQRLRPDPDDTEYYATVLEPLFFETLNQQRPNLESKWGKIPYLNGGLFDRDYGAGIKDAAGRLTPETVTLPNGLFDPGDTDSILGFFNGYNFTIAENVAGDEDVAVDPEMLGKVFENMLAAEERGQSGTFYTPRGIVQFMCSEVLSRYLADETGMSLEAVQKLIDYDPDLPDKEFNALMTPQQARQLKQAIASIKVLDPAVGSGAFPLGMMQVILNVRQAIARREGMKVSRGSLTISQWKRDIIANNLYGVDIKPEAIEIAKLRMWLSLVVDIPNIEDVEPLPNLDYKLMCGDSLISTIHGEQLIPDPTKTQQGMLAVTPIQQAIQPLLDLEHRYFDAQTEERHQLREQILEAEANVFRVAVGDRRDYWLGKQKDLEAKIKTMKGKVSKAQEKEQAEIKAKLAELDKFAKEVESGERSLNFFQYHLHFRDVFESKGGFDVVIGNPPYVRQEAIKELKPALQAEYDCYTGVADLYVYFYEQGLRLLKPKGLLSYISSNKWFKANYGAKLRKYLAEKSQVHNITDFGELPVFEAATFPMILIGQKWNTERTSTLFTQVKSLDSPYPNIKAIIDIYGEILPYSALNGETWILGNSDSASFLEKMRLSGIPLGDYVQEKIYYGIKTGFNQAFVINNKIRESFINEDANSADVIKPLAVGDDIRKWHIRDSNKWLIFIPWHFPLHENSSITGVSLEAEKLFTEKYPVIYEYLKSYKKQLSERNKSETGIRYEWYALQRYGASYWKEFEKPKFIYPAMMMTPRFTFDTDRIYINQKCFIISTAELYILGLLNSSIVWGYLKKISVCFGDPEKRGRLEPRREDIAGIPIPTAPEPDRLAIEALVQKCLDAKGVGVEEWEAEIDDRVAHLYGLTDEEMKIIRGE